MKVWSIYVTEQPEVSRAWRPPVDVYRRGSEWLLKFDLAGVRAEDVQIRISGPRVTVAGVRRDWVVEQGYSYHSMEICYNRFERTVELPGDLAAIEYSLEARDGLLLVRIGTERSVR